jgi:UDP-N-acetylmuramoylalanine--D-glutamate ligase
MKISILGAGKSGIAAAKLAKNKEYDVFLSEFSSSDIFVSEKQELENLKINHEFGQHTLDKILKSDLVISSPGIPPHAPIIQELAKNNIKVIDETEFAYQFLNQNKIIAVTGTNGKTTTTSLIHHIFSSCGKKSWLSGNIGIPLSTLVDKVENNDFIILELSSYQLDRTFTLKADVTIILNITPDHISWHGTYEQYILAKWKISARQTKDDLLVLPLSKDEVATDDVQVGVGTNSKAQIALININDFSANDSGESRENLAEKINCGIISENGFIKFITQQKDCLRSNSDNEEEILMPINELALRGKHNLYNSMAAAIAARRYEIPNEDIRDALSDFSGVEHRLENVKTIDKVTYINDSKATNINAVWFALSSFGDSPLIWIAGGVGENDYSTLDKIVSKNVIQIISFGEESDNIFNHFSVLTKCAKVADLDEAVELSYKLAKENDIVLFSPACKSFDSYTNYEQRGQHFKRIVRSLNSEK